MERLGTAAIITALIGCLPDSIGEIERKRLAIRFTRVIRENLPRCYRCNICGGLVTYDGTEPKPGCWGGR